ncbi:MAG: hypothetical protein ACRCZF_16805, partial [Gemmataceae bacterium]
MPERSLVLLSPYRPPTSYPVTLSPDETTAWLNAYFLMWDPALLATAPGLPEIASAYDHDLPREEAIYVIPTGPQLFQPDEWPERVKAANAVAVAIGPDRTLAETTLRAAAALPPPRGDERSFAAIGLAHLL